MSREHEETVAAWLNPEAFDARHGGPLLGLMVVNPACGPNRPARVSRGGGSTFPAPG